MRVFLLDKSNQLSDVGQPLSIFRKVQLFLLAFLYGFILAKIPNENFFDFQNYLNYTENSLVVLGLRVLEGPFSVISNEPIWLLINSALSQFLDSESVVRVIIFFSATTISWLLLINNPKNVFWIILFLLLPQVLKNNLIHLRQGLAISIFFIGWFQKNRILRGVFLSLSPLVHSSFFFILVFLLLTRLFLKIRLANHLRVIFYFIVTIILALSLESLTIFIGARQSDKFLSQSITGSGLGFIIWFLIFVTMITSSRDFKRKHAFEIGILIFYLGAYWFIEISSRVFESGLLLILLSGLSLNRSNRIFFCLIFILIIVITWLMRLNAPIFGFGAID
jgi:hypothetical protein